MPRVVADSMFARMGIQIATSAQNAESLAISDYERFILAKRFQSRFEYFHDSLMLAELWWTPDSVTSINDAAKLVTDLAADFATELLGDLGPSSSDVVEIVAETYHRKIEWSTPESDIRLSWQTSGKSRNGFVNLRLGCRNLLARALAERKGVLNCFPSPPKGSVEDRDKQ